MALDFLQCPVFLTLPERQTGLACVGAEPATLPRRLKEPESANGRKGPWASRDRLAYGQRDSLISAQHTKAQQGRQGRRIRRQQGETERVCGLACRQ